MSNVALAGNHFIGRARLYVDVLDPTTGLTTGLFFEGNVEEAKASVTPTTASKRDFSQKSAPILAEGVFQTDVQFSWTCDEYTAKNLKQHLMATGGTTSAQSSGTVTTVSPESFTAYKDGFLELAFKNVSAVVLKDSAGTTTYVLGTDYSVYDATRGIVYIIPGGAIVDAQIVKASYTYGTYAAKGTLAIGNNPLQTARIKLTGDNLSGPNRDLDLWKVRIAGDGDVSFITSGNDFGTFNIKGTVLADNVGHPNSPLGLITDL